MHDVVFYDGLCGLCDRTVQFLIRNDPQQKLRYLALQTARAEEVLAPFASELPPAQERLSTLIYLSEGKVYVRSAAVVRLFWKIQYPWPVIGTLLWLVPRPVRDFGYRFVAKIRYRVFGKFDTCPLPTAATRELFLK